MAKQKDTTGIIRSDELYTVDAFRRLMVLTASAWRALRSRGLPVIRVGKRAYVSGRKAMEFLEGLGDDNSRESYRPRPGQPGASLDGPTERQAAAEGNLHPAA